MKNRSRVILAFILAIAVGIPAAQALEERTESETFTIPSADVTLLSFKKIAFTDMSYRGVDDTSEFTVVFKKTARAGSDERVSELLDRISLETDEDGDALSLILVHPKTRKTGVFNPLKGKTEWEVRLEVTGPTAIDIDIDASFSEIKTVATEGEIKCNNDFGETDIIGHNGFVRTNIEFGELDIRELDGSFSVNTNFGEADIEMIRIDDSCEGSASFGSINLNIPREAGVELENNESLGSTDFNIIGDWTGNGSSRRILNGGGPLIRLNVEFGKLRVSNTVRGEPMTASPRRTNPSRQSLRSHSMPLDKGAWWRYDDNGHTLDIAVIESDRNGAVLRFEENNEHIADVTVIDKKNGLHIAAIDGVFFGREMSGITFNPPTLWLPYSTGHNIVDNFVLGTISASDNERIDTDADTFDNCFKYHIALENGVPHILHLKPGVGIVGFGDYRLISYDTGEREKIAETSCKPDSIRQHFTEGVVTSIEIYGERMLEEQKLRKALGITVGETYTRREIFEKVDTLERDNKFIADAWLTIDHEGHLRVTIREHRPRFHDPEPIFSYSRVGGLGIGPGVTFSSMVGPISEIKGATEYHFGNKEWTYRIRGEKRLFNNALALGGTYRLDYESSMDWAIPDRDSHMNALLLGLETKNWYEVEGATGYARLKLLDAVTLSGSYFEESFSSLKKHTNWSVFNHRHIKDDNTPLAPLEEGRIVGIRTGGTFRFGNSYAKTKIHVDVEHALDKKHNTVGDYTRYFGNIVQSWRFYPDNILKIRLAGGYSEDVLPGPRAFSLGGINTLRGYDYQSIPGGLPFTFQYGGSKMALMNVEYSMGDVEDLGIVLFADAGDVWLKGQEVKFDQIKRDIGIGVLIDFDMFDFDPLDHADFEHFNGEDMDIEGLRVNWAVPVGNVAHTSHWTVNFVRSF